MKKILIVPCLLAVFSHSTTQADSFEECEREENMPAVRSCVIDISDTTLDELFQRVLATVSDKEMRETLRASQTAFINYRAESCGSVMANYQQHGWMAQDLATNCYTRLTAQRATFLALFFEERL